MKRIFDVSCSLILLIASLPIMVIIAIAIKVSSPGPIIFRQERAGLHGKTFIILKFRSMHDYPEPEVMVVKGRNDPRITSVGRIMRSTYLDELPQLWNVIKGDMSLVGPRPVPISISKRREKEIHGYKRRFEVRPGITGIVQIRVKEDFLVGGPQRAHVLNRWYIRNQSHCLDLMILFRTFYVVFAKTGI